MALTTVVPIKEVKLFNSVLVENKKHPLLSHCIYKKGSYFDVGGFILNPSKIITIKLSTFYQLITNSFIYKYVEKLLLYQSKSFK